VLIDGAQLEAPAAPLDDLLRPGLEAAPSVHIWFFGRGAKREIHV